jgi:hypothetical protein
MLSSSSASTMHSREGLPPPKRNRSTRLSSALCTPPSARRDWKGKEIGIIGPLPTYRSGGSAQVIRTSQRAFRAKKHGPQCKDSLTFRTKTRVPRASQDVLLKRTCPPHSPGTDSNATGDTRRCPWEASSIPRQSSWTEYTRKRLRAVLGKVGFPSPLAKPNALATKACCFVRNNHRTRTHNRVRHQSPAKRRPPTHCRGM